MNIAFVTHDIIPEKSHLMPWRTICELVKHSASFGVKAQVLSLSDHTGPLDDDRLPLNTFCIKKSRGELGKELDAFISSNNIDCIYWPISWRESNWRIDILKDISVSKIAYFPGGVYSLKTAMYAARHLGFKQALPYLMESLVSKKRVLQRLKKVGISQLIALTDLTRQSAIEAGWSVHNVQVITPGRDNDVSQLNIDSLPSTLQSWLGGSPYYLFMGPPSKIRGISELLKAFNIAAQVNQQIKLICLFRSDAKLDAIEIKQYIETCDHKDRIHCEWESLDRNVLNSFIKFSHMIAMPFVLVPSEIPLAIIEAMAWGKPIITTSPSGTGEFVDAFGAAPEVGDINKLALDLQKFAEDKMLYEKKCKLVKEQFNRLPDWKEMTQSWLDINRHAMTTSESNEKRISEC